LDEKHTTQNWQDYYNTADGFPPHAKPRNEYDAKTILKHLGLFLLTFTSVSLLGASFVGYNAPLFPFIMPGLQDIYRGALFAALLLGFLGVHEFGHFFAAMYHKIRVTLPYFIPLPLGIGTMGAVIRIKQKINDTRKMFDIGIAGPLAGFVVSLVVLLYGFATLPGPDYINNFVGHEQVKQFVNMYGQYPDQPLGSPSGSTLIVGNTLLYSFLAQFFENVPPMWEMYHYPFLFAGWLGLFFTALNLVPVGQLDGGHILYSLIGFEKHRRVARICFAGLTILAGIESIPFIHISLGEWDGAYGSLSWIFWAGILFTLLRKAYDGDHRWIAPVLIVSLAASAAYLYGVVGSIETSSSLIWIVWSFFIAYVVRIEHPPSLYERELSTTRKALGWASMVVFVLCISPNPLYFI
jgi:membrane-associated protease RseP (regulator of RpoE activity)